MTTATELFSPEQIFKAFLYEQIKRDKAQENVNASEVHRAFYLAQKEFPDFMSEYEMLLRTEPYSPTLHRMVRNYRQDGVLTEEDGKYTIRNPEPIKEPPEELRPVAEYICDKV